MIRSAVVLRNRLVAKARLRQLQVFIGIAEAGSVTRAAQGIGLSQPAITQTLLDLETLMECALFLRHARGVQLTVEGQALLPVARRILAAVNDGAEQVVAAATHGSDLVRAAAIPPAVTGLLVEAIPAFQRQHPDIVLQLVEADSHLQPTMLAAGAIDLAFCRTPRVVQSGWRFVPLVEDRFMVVAGRGHPLLGQASVDLSDLRQAEWMVAPLRMAAREVYDRLFQDEDAAPRIAPVITDIPEIFWAMLTQGSLLTILSSSSARQLIRQGELFEVPLAEKLPSDHIGMLLPETDSGLPTQVFARFMQDFCGAA